eukprot:Filipodium_phascolosomae@DN2802_c0_g1_i19.p1
MAVPPSSDASYLLPIFCLSSPHLLPIFSHFAPTTRRLQAIHQSSGLSLMAAPSSLQSLFQHFQSAALLTSYKLSEDFCVPSVAILRPSSRASYFIYQTAVPGAPSPRLETIQTNLKPNYYNSRHNSLICVGFGFEKTMLLWLG